MACSVVVGIVIIVGVGVGVGVGNNLNHARIDKSKGEDFLITGIILTAATIYTAIVGDGNPVDGLETIGQGSDPLSKVITQGAQTAIELSYEHFPDKTQNIITTTFSFYDWIIIFIILACVSSFASIWSYYDLSITRFSRFSRFISGIFV
jgi:hypothetical protein